MKEFEIKDLKISVPTSWAEVKMMDYEKWNHQDIYSQEGKMQYVADICKLNINDLKEFPHEVYHSILEAVAFAFNADVEPQYVTEIEGEKYFMSDSSKLTLGEWVDVDAVLNNEDEHNKWAQMLSILCRPVAEKYSVDVSAKRVDIFQQMTCDKALPLVSFFLLKNKNLDKTLNHYLRVEAEANQFLKDIKTFVESGAGTRPLPIWQRIRFYFLTRSLKKQLSRYSDLCSIV